MLATLISLVLVAPVCLQEDEPNPVQTALDQTHQQISKGKWKAAKKGLLRLIKAEAESTELVAHWPRLAEELALCTFWTDYKVPKPDDVVPEIVSWKESRGALKLRYRKGDSALGTETGNAGGFIRVGGEDSATPIFLHPVRFTGPYSIEISGRKLRRTPMIFAEWVWNSLRGLGFGKSYLVHIGNLASIYAFENGGMSRIDDSSTGLEMGKPYSFEVRVASNAVSVSYNGKRQLKVSREKGDYGQFGLSDLSSFDEVEIIGEVDAAWIAGLVQGRVHDDWAKFNEGYDPLDEIPDALRQRVKGVAHTERSFGFAYPGPVDERNDPVMEKARDYFEEGEWTEGLKYINALPEDQVTAPARAWVRANFAVYAGEADVAFKELQAVVDADPNFFEARLYHSRMNHRRAEEADALSATEQLLLDFPKHVEPYEDLALLHLYSDRLPVAEDVMLTAAENGMPMEKLRSVGVTLLRKRFGPRWPERDTYASRYYEVSSNASKTICVRVATQLDKVYRQYQSEIGRIAGDKDMPKFPVYFFAGEAGYQDYCADLMGDPAENTLGVFHPALKQLLVWDSPNPGSTMATVRHEGFHQYFDRLVGDSPVWFNEGMAEYYEQAGFEGGRWKDDHINQEHVALLRAARKSLTPLKQLVYSDNRTFRSRSGMHYAMSWAFVHFMKNGDREHKKLIKSLLDALKDGASNDDAIEAAFGGVDWPELEQQFVSYALALE